MCLKGVGVNAIRPFVKFLGAGLCLLWLAGCATSPTGRSQLMLVSEEAAIDASKTAYTEMLKPFEDEGKLDNDPALKARVDRITGRLIAQAIIMRPETRNWDWSMKIIDDPETVNAWAMAGGKMALYTGLVDKVKPTDDELAQVLGHEISHALAKHTAEKMSVALATQLGVVAVGASTDNKNAVRRPKRTGSASSWLPRRATIPVPLPPSGARWAKWGAVRCPSFSAPIPVPAIGRRPSASWQRR